MARLAAGYTHCTAPDCVRAWRRERISSEHLALVLVPKSGFTIIYKPDAAGTGKSSGR